ncbi:tyrosine--tRNA ligase [Candidatus Daviesbacteria bacterium]|nr:tyrosine--tRNA ligase [Candidatus Daviesbacteria bacterium]
MTTDEKLKLITRNLEEVLTEEELKALIESETPLKHYIGFEISGKGHMGWVYTMQKIKDLQEAGVEVNILLADWHTWLNKKLDGMLETAKRMAKEYFEEALKACALSAGTDPNKINFILGSELYEKLGSSYWAMVIKVAKATTLARMIRSTTIMGRKNEEISDSAMLIYPAMQSADIFALGVNIAHAGTDQRNVHVVAREAANALDKPKPIAIHHHLLQGLMQPVFITDESGKKVLDLEAAKMSKSKPDSAIFIHDSGEEIKRKINGAWSPEGVTEYNPILDWVKHLIFYKRSGASSTKVAPQPRSHLNIRRDQVWGGNVTYTSYEDLEKDYAEKKLHPQDLKNAVAEWLIKKLEPARKYFEDPTRKQALEEIEELTLNS